MVTGSKKSAQVKRDFLSAATSVCVLDGKKTELTAKCFNCLVFERTGIVFSAPALGLDADYFSFCKNITGLLLAKPDWS